MRRIRNRLTYANVMSTLAVVLALGGGVAYAANTVFSSDIVNGEVYSADVRDDTLAGGGLTASDLRAGAVRTSEVLNDGAAGGGLAASDLRAGSVGSSEVADGSVQESDLDASALGARAYAAVDAIFCGNPLSFCTLLRSKGVAYVAHVAEGRFCVGVDGIDAADPSSVAVVTQGGSAGWASWRLENSACVGSEFEISTGFTDVPGGADLNFTIVIP